MALLKDKRKLELRTQVLILVGVLMMCLSWVVDAWIDAHFDHGQLLHEIFHPDNDELLIRLVFVATQLAFIAYIAVLFNRRRDLENQLVEALRQQQQERSKSAAVLESIGDAISIQDLELRVLYQNAAHRRLMGDQQGEYCYRAYQKRDAVCPVCHVIESFRDGEVHRRETATEHSTRGRVEVEVVSTPLRDADGQIFAGIEAVRDITERKRNEALLRRMTADLEARTRELSEANAELEAFGSTLAHDIRSFLARIATAAETLQQTDGERLSADGRYCAETISTTCDSMEQLIDSIMLLSLVSHRNLQRSPVDLTALAGEILDELRQREPQRAVEIRIDPGLVAHGDPGLLRVALENLLGNAWKYTRDAVPARISFSAREDGGEGYFSIEDNGVGFAMQDVDRLFRPFGRLASGRSFPGAGIGLTTVKRIILRHGGEIVASGEPGKGARFSFRLAGE